MRDIFLEETVNIVDHKSANTKYIIFNVLTILLYATTIIWFYNITLNMFSLFSIPFFLLGVLPNAIFLIGAILMGKARDSFFVEYDYRFINGDVNISKVIKAKKRKNGISFKCSELEKLGLYGSEDYNKYEHFPNVKKMIMTSNTMPQNKNGFFYAVFKRNEDKYLVIMECSRNFINLIASHSNKSIIDGELKNIWFT